MGVPAVVALAGFLACLVPTASDAEVPPPFDSKACTAVGGPVVATREPRKLVECTVSGDPVQQAWVGRAATRVGAHAKAAAAWSLVEREPALRELARREHILALARDGRRVDATHMLGVLPRGATARQRATFAELGLITGDARLLLAGAPLGRKDSDRDYPAELDLRRLLGFVNSADRRGLAYVRLAREGTRALNELPLADLKDPPILSTADLATRWKNAQLVGRGEMAAEECTAWVAALPADTTPAIDDAVAACGRLTSLLRLPAALGVLQRATTKPATANAAWLGIARIRARTDDLDAIDEACSHVGEKSIEAAECFTLTAVLRLRAGHLDVARARLHELDVRFPKSPKRREAWMQFVMQRWDDPEVPKILEGLLQSATDPVAKAESAYWLGRKASDPVTARNYWEISRTADPLGYFGALSNARLEGPTATAKTPVRTTPADKTLALLRRAGFYEEAERRVAKGRNTKQVVNQMAVIGEGGAWETVVRAGILGGGETRWPASPLTRAAFPIAFPDELSAVPDARRPLLLSLMRRESLFDPDAISFVGARGLLQLMPKTAARLSTDAALPVPTPEDMHLPALNVDLADRYVSLLFERFQHPLLVAAAYNAGPPAVLKWIAETKTRDLDLFVERIPYRETRLYVRAVAAALSGYTRLETGQFPAIALHVPTPAATGVDY